MSDKGTLIALLEPKVEAMGYELVDLLFRQGHKHALLRLYIDRPGDEGVGLDDCERVSDQIGGELDVADPIPTAFDLEVSSPGFDRPLRTEAHFLRFMGQRAKVELSAHVEGRRNFTGEIQAVADGRLSLSVDGEGFEVRIEDIDRARLKPPR